MARDYYEKAEGYMEDNGFQYDSRILNDDNGY
jgi:hypothetical protein